MSQGETGLLFYERTFERVIKGEKRNFDGEKETAWKVKERKKKRSRVDQDFLRLGMKDN